MAKTIRSTYNKIVSEKTREDGLRYLSSLIAGAEMNTLLARHILDIGDWSQFWPIVSQSGKKLIYTGDIIDSSDEYANVDDIAMIAISEVKPSQVDDSGYFHA